MRVNYYKEVWETVEHFRRCPKVKEERRAISKILYDDESGKEWTKMILERRNKLNN